MEVRLSPDLHAKLTRLAVAQAAMRSYWQEKPLNVLWITMSGLFARLKKGLDQIERGETLSHAEVGVRFETLLSQPHP
jgi:predicted transcriptional regulator